LAYEIPHTNQPKPQKNKNCEAVVRKVKNPCLNKIMEPFYKFKINAVFEKDKRKGLPLKA
jgi:hypothetical protein